MQYSGEQQVLCVHMYYRIRYNNTYPFLLNMYTYIYIIIYTYHIYIHTYIRVHNNAKTHTPRSIMNGIFTAAAF